MKQNPACRTCGEEMEVRVNSNGGVYAVCANEKCSKFKPVRGVPVPAPEKKEAAKNGEPERPKRNWRSGLFG